MTNWHAIKENFITCKLLIQNKLYFLVQIFCTKLVNAFAIKYNKNSKIVNNELFLGTVHKFNVLKQYSNLLKKLYMLWLM